MPIDNELLDILACPACKADVNYDQKKELICCTNKDCRRNYPVRDGIPVMLIDESIIDNN